MKAGQPNGLPFSDISLWQLLYCMCSQSENVSIPLVAGRKFDLPDTAAPIAQLRNALTKAIDALEPFVNARMKVDGGGADNAGFIGADLCLGDLRDAQSAFTERPPLCGQGPYDAGMMAFFRASSPGPERQPRHPWRSCNCQRSRHH
jgi:hypothetical protein